MLCTDRLVAKEQLLRKIDMAANFERIYDMIEHLYCEDNGRPSVDPVALFNLVLIQHIYGIRSVRQTVKEAERRVSVVHRVSHGTANPAFCDDPLCFCNALFLRLSIIGLSME